jgi:hypothetical protein
MKQIKPAAIIASLILCLTFLAACSSNGELLSPSKAASQPISATVAQNGPWRVTVLGSETRDTLSGSQNALQYNGENVSTEIRETPVAGNVFLLLNIKIEKAQPGSSAFSWKKLYIADGSGNKYARCDNDSFLESYGYKRIKSTDLTLGDNDGFICFEIPSGLKTNGLTLNYVSDDGDISIKLD